jgi:hypothetical protein
MMTNDLQKTLERLRSEKYQDLDKDLVANLIIIQADFMEKQAEAYKRISRALDEYLQRKGA